MADAPEVFAECNAKFADNVQRYYRYCRDNDLFLTHTLVNPPVDRSKSASQQADEYAYLGVVEETKDGLIVRGAKMLATHGPTADELIVYPLPFSVRPGEEKYALAFAIPTDTPGLRFICREPFDPPSNSVLHRLAAAGSAVWRTDVQGTITIKTDGRSAPFVEGSGA